MVSSCSKKCVEITRMSCSSSQKPKGDPREIKHLLKQWLGPGMALPLTGPLVAKSHAAAAMLDLSRRPQPRCSQTSSHPGLVPPLLLMLLLTHRERETETSSTWGKHYSATTTPSMCHQHYPHAEYEHVALHQLLGSQLTLSQPEPGQGLGLGLGEKQSGNLSPEQGCKRAAEGRGRL